MLKVGPINNEEKIYIEYKQKLSEKYNDKLYVLRLTDNDDILGYIACDLDDIYLRILDIDMYIDNYKYTEFFLKSLCAFAQNRNKFTMKCENTNIYNIIEKYSTLVKNNIIYIDTIKFTTCSCKNKDN